MFGEPDIWEARLAEPKPWSSEDIDLERDVGEEEPSLITAVIVIVCCVSGGGGGNASVSTFLFMLLISSISLGNERDRNAVLLFGSAPPFVWLVSQSSRVLVVANDVSVDLLFVVLAIRDETLYEQVVELMLPLPARLSEKFELASA